MSDEIKNEIATEQDETVQNTDETLEKEGILSDKSAYHHGQHSACNSHLLQWLRNRNHRRNERSHKTSNELRKGGIHRAYATCTRQARR